MGLFDIVVEVTECRPDEEVMETSEEEGTTFEVVIKF